MQAVDDLVDREAYGIAVRGVHATRRGTVESQPSQMSADRRVDDVGGGVVLSCGIQYRSDIEACGVTFSHTGLDVGGTVKVPLFFSGVR
ncbi:hypothetical protein MAGR_34100 [Mycolicibacterium agri]|uniref:Uncharacterized protein n=1 Tax=Mycolicibacterium agri TaxID=36811 RepID=A0A7I9W3L6_MYCAG|nr:hypothetical protein MAGR_34100 [Mycolicibacterium agri]